MGQSVIHPVHTGQVADATSSNKAWAAQDDPSYSAQEKSQILAFAYGFLTHAAGDMWAHTLVNESGEAACSPASRRSSRTRTTPRSRSATSSSRATSATQRRASTGTTTARRCRTATSATTRPPASASTRRSAGSTRRSSIPNAAGAPSTARGPLIGFFTGLRSSLQDFVGGSFSDDIAAGRAELRELEVRARRGERGVLVPAEHHQVPDRAREAGHHGDRRRVRRSGRRSGSGRQGRRPPAALELRARLDRRHRQRAPRLGRARSRIDAGAVRPTDAP